MTISCVKIKGIFSILFKKKQDFKITALGGKVFKNKSNKQAKARHFSGKQLKVNMFPYQVLEIQNKYAKPDCGTRLSPMWAIVVLSHCEVNVQADERTDGGTGGAADGVADPAALETSCSVIPGGSVGAAQLP